VIRAYICGDGFLGTELSKDFNENSHYSVSSQFLELKRPQSLKSKQLEIISQEFHDQNNSIFINASGPSSVQESFSNYEVAVEQPSQQVLKHMEILSFTQEPILYVYISSASVYGETSNLGVTEDGALNPMSPYAEGKIKAEDTLKSLMQNINPLVSILILRVFSAYSENLTTRILNKIVVAAKQNQHIDLAGDGHESRDFTHSSDISRVIKFWEKKGEQRRQIFNVGSGERIQNRVVVNKIINKFKIKNLKKLIMKVKDRPGHDLRYALNSNNFLKDYNWKPKYKFTIGIRKTIKWFIDNPEWINYCKKKYKGKRIGVG
jgi:dTDP-glucose 4,6-dehydratase